jgi:hypothetical protein
MKIVVPVDGPASLAALDFLQSALGARPASEKADELP